MPSVEAAVAHEVPVLVCVGAAANMHAHPHGCIVTKQAGLCASAAVAAEIDWPGAP